ncbi:MAG: hypothetical protein ABJC66_11140 [Gammaproteobacteria bacterium]
MNLIAVMDEERQTARQYSWLATAAYRYRVHWMLMAPAQGVVGVLPPTVEAHLVIPDVAGIFCRLNVVLSPGAF